MSPHECDQLFHFFLLQFWWPTWFNALCFHLPPSPCFSISPCVSISIGWGLLAVSWALQRLPERRENDLASISSPNLTYVLCACVRACVRLRASFILAFSLVALVPALSDCCVFIVAHTHTHKLLSLQSKLGICSLLCEGEIGSVECLGRLPVLF